MIHSIWTMVIYRPLANMLLLIISVMPNFDTGMAIILITLLIKFALAPTTARAIRSQMQMKELQPHLDEIKANTPDKAEQQKKVYALYKERKVNPFASCLPIIIQIIVLGSLYFIFRNNFDTLATVTYPFLSNLASVVPNPHFLGYFDVTHKSLVLALIAGATQYIQGVLMQKRTTASSKNDGKVLVAPGGMQAQFAQMMQKQMLYVLPVMVVIFAYQISTAVALYFITSNLFTIGQEIYIARKMKKATTVVVKAR